MIGICARLGIRLIHSRPYRPQGRGKIERFFATVTSQFLPETTTDAADATGGAGSAVSSLQELNALFTSWVEVVYHRAAHTTTGQTPLARWQAGWDGRSPRRRGPEQIAEAFRWSAHRQGTRGGTGARR